MVARKQSGAQGQQPEALNTFSAAARSGGVKPRNQGLTSEADTAPKAKNLSNKNKAAADYSRPGPRVGHERAEPLSVCRIAERRKAGALHRVGPRTAQGSAMGIGCCTSIASAAAKHRSLRKRLATS
jgi:hypothetical protein